MNLSQESLTIRDALRLLNNIERNEPDTWKAITQYNCKLPSDVPDEQLFQEDSDCEPEDDTGAPLEAILMNMALPRIATQAIECDTAAEDLDALPITPTRPITHRESNPISEWEDTFDDLPSTSGPSATSTPLAPGPSSFMTLDRTPYQDLETQYSSYDHDLLLSLEKMTSYLLATDTPSFDIGRPDQQASYTGKGKGRAP